MAKKRTTKAAATANNSLAKLRKPNGGKTLAQLPKAEREKLLAEFAASIASILDSQRRQWEEMFAAWERRDTVEIPDWLESLGLPRDIRLAGQVALAEYGEFATADDFDDCTHSNVIELIKVVAAKKEWERKLAARNNRRQTSGQPRADEPTEAYLLVGREVLAEMARNPSVESFREAVRSKGLKGSNAKLGKLLSFLKGERLKK